MSDTRIKLQNVVDKISPLLVDYQLENYQSWNRKPEASIIFFMHSVLNYARSFMHVLRYEDENDELLIQMCDCFSEPLIVLKNPELISYFTEMMTPATAPNGSIFKRYYWDCTIWLKNNRNHNFDLGDMLGCIKHPF